MLVLSPCTRSLRIGSFVVHARLERALGVAMRLFIRSWLSDPCGALRGGPHVGVRVT